MGVTKAVGKVQIEAHDKREEIITHVNTQGDKVQEAINALRNGGTKLNAKRKEDEAKRLKKLKEDEEKKKIKDEEVEKKLTDHTTRIESNTAKIEKHEDKLIVYEVKHKTARHQLDLVKDAMDSDCGGGYGTTYLKGTSRDKLKNWDQENPRLPWDRNADQTSRRRLPANYASMRLSEQALTRRRLMNRPNSHVVVLEQLLGEINRLNATN